jgi:hypothetical protein
LQKLNPVLGTVGNETRFKNNNSNSPGVGEYNIIGFKSLGKASESNFNLINFKSQYENKRVSEIGRK